MSTADRGSVTGSRRRSERSRRAILDGALQVATEVGYARVSIEAIAACAGVGKQTIYRWWPSKGAVLIDAFLEQAQPKLEWEDRGNLAEELIAQVTRVHAVLSDPQVAPHMVGLVAEAQRDPHVAERFRDTVVVPYREMTQQRLQAAQRRGDLDASANIGLLADALFAPLWFRLLIGAAPLDEFDPTAHVRQLLAGVTGADIRCP